MFNEIILIAGVPIIRNVAGWLEASLEDGKICAYEVKQLVSTTLRLAVPGFALYFGFDATPEIAATAPLVADYVFSYLKKVFKKWTGLQQIGYLSVFFFFSIISKVKLWPPCRARISLWRRNMHDKFPYKSVKSINYDIDIRPYSELNVGTSYIDTVEGEAFRTTGNIFLNETLPTKRLKLVFLHELIHMFDDVSGIKSLTETQVDLLALHFLHFIKNNKKLIKFLQQQDKPIT